MLAVILEWFYIKSIRDYFRNSPPVQGALSEADGRKALCELSGPLRRKNLRQGGPLCESE